jgi:hypothetical protein
MRRRIGQRAAQFAQGCVSPRPEPERAMKTNEILHMLGCVSKRLATLADQAHETREQAQHTLDRIYLLREDVERLQERILDESNEDEEMAVRSEVCG